MTTANDALFEPLNGPVITPTSAGGIYPSGISRRPDMMSVEIIPTSPKHVYTDAAHEVIDLAVKCHPQMVDVRAPGAKVPTGAFRLDTLVDRFHDGDKEFWVACPGLTPPRQFEFAGRFGHYKVWRLTQIIGHHRIAQFVAQWFWMDSNEGQLSAIELGTVLVSPGSRLHHVFGSRIEAQSYYVT